MIGLWRTDGGIYIAGYDWVVVEFLCQTLSGCVQLDVMVSYVGMSGGSTIIMLCSVIKSRSGFITSAKLYRCLLLLGSHRGW